MLIKLNEWVKPNRNLDRPHRGTVLDNDDPLQLGRLKVEVIGHFVGETEDLPWVHPQNPYGLGGKSDSSSFSVPEVGSELIVIFPFRNIYAPVYVGYWQNTINHQTDFDENYPETYGFRDSTGTVFKINKEVGYLELVHKSGTKIMINDAGDLMFDIVGSLSWDIAGAEHKVAGGVINSDAASQQHQGGTANPIYSQ